MSAVKRSAISFSCTRILLTLQFFFSWLSTSAAEFVYSFFFFWFGLFSNWLQVAGSQCSAAACDHLCRNQSNVMRRITYIAQAAQAAVCVQRSASLSRLLRLLLTFCFSNRNDESTTVLHSLKPTSSSNLFHERGSEQFLPRFGVAKIFPSLPDSSKLL